MNIIKDIAMLQDNWDKLADSGNMTMQAIRKLCIPFRDKYNLTDSQTLQIARREATTTQIEKWIEENKVLGGSDG